jgi:hypothetical protein
MGLFGLVNFSEIECELKTQMNGAYKLYQQEQWNFWLWMSAAKACGCNS